VGEQVQAHGISTYFPYDSAANARAIALENLHTILLVEHRYIGARVQPEIFGTCPRVPRFIEMGVAFRIHSGECASQMCLELRILLERRAPPRIPRGDDCMTLALLPDAPDRQTHTLHAGIFIPADFGIEFERLIDVSDGYLQLLPHELPALFRLHPRLLACRNDRFAERESLRGIRI